VYRIHEIKLGIDEDISSIPNKIKRKLKTQSEIPEYKIVKESLDARDKGNIKYVYTVDFNINGKFPLLEKARQEVYVCPKPGGPRKNPRPVITGFGPCGMFAALILAESGYAPIVLERGRRVGERVDDVDLFFREGVLNTESNVQFGEGGAGTFSDGKLTTGINDKRVNKVLAELAAAGAGEDILYRQKPHIGTDVLRTVVKNIREKIISYGGELLFETKLSDIITEQNELVAVKTYNRGELKEIETGDLILATGHSARDTVQTLFDRGLLMEQKPFSIGVRIEHLQEKINEAQYGKKAARHLPPAEYKLSYRSKNGRGVYTFCMCPGGEVIVSSSQAGYLVTNGMSYRARSGKYANGAVLVDVRTSDFETAHPLSGIAFQEKYEQAAFRLGGANYKAPRATWGELTTGTGTSSLVTGAIPPFAAECIIEAMPSFGYKLRGFDSPEARLYAVESRSSSPVRIKRNQDLESNIKGIYPGGEGAGYAGGIISAAVDGIKIAEMIVKKS